MEAQYLLYVILDRLSKYIKTVYDEIASVAVGEAISQDTIKVLKI
jgi:hypothetical protein